MDRVPLARVLRAHGVRGELRVKLYNADSRTLAPGLLVDLVRDGALLQTAELVKLRPVQDALVTARESDVWLEVLNLVVPTLNDSPKMLTELRSKPSSTWPAIAAPTRSVRWIARCTRRRIHATPSRLAGGTTRTRYASRNDATP